MASLSSDTPAGATVADTRGRHLRDLRISVTDRCNFRCTYCMPKEVYGRDFQFLERSQLLSFDEINRLVGIFKHHGIEKVRITGGEPLVRRQLERLIEMLAQDASGDHRRTVADHHEQPAKPHPATAGRRPEPGHRQS